MLELASGGRIALGRDGNNNVLLHVADAETEQVAKLTLGEALYFATQLRIAVELTQKNSWAVSRGEQQTREELEQQILAKQMSDFLTPERVSKLLSGLAAGQDLKVAHAEVLNDQAEAAWQEYAASAIPWGVKPDEYTRAHRRFLADWKAERAPGATLEAFIAWHRDFPLTSHPELTLEQWVEMREDYINAKDD